MSENEYQNETCEGCLLFYPGADSQICTVKQEPGAKRPVVKQYPGPSRCDRFRPSLQCRQVRALEKAAEMLTDLCGCLRDDGMGGLMLDVKVIQ
jgi:hypothetical protein